MSSRGKFIRQKPENQPKHTKLPGEWVTSEPDFLPSIRKARASSQLTDCCALWLRGESRGDRVSLVSPVLVTFPEFPTPSSQGWRCQHLFAHYVNENHAACSSLTFGRTLFFVFLLEKTEISHKNYLILIRKLCGERLVYTVQDPSSGTNCPRGRGSDKHLVLKYNKLGWVFFLFFLFLLPYKSDGSVRFSHRNWHACGNHRALMEHKMIHNLKKKERLSLLGGNRSSKALAGTAFLQSKTKCPQPGSFFMVSLNI